MFPVLFNIGNISIETYYVVWLAALYLALLWTFMRMTLYKIDGNEGRSGLGKLDKEISGNLSF